MYGEEQPEKTPDYLYCEKLDFILWKYIFFYIPWFLLSTAVKIIQSGVKKEHPDSNTQYLLLHILCTIRAGRSLIRQKYNRADQGSRRSVRKVTHKTAGNRA